MYYFSMQCISKCLFKLTNQFSSTNCFTQDVLCYISSSLLALTEQSKQQYGIVWESLNHARNKEIELEDSFPTWRQVQLTLSVSFNIVLLATFLKVCAHPKDFIEFEPLDWFCCLALAQSIGGIQVVSVKPEPCHKQSLLDKPYQSEKRSEKTAPSVTEGCSCKALVVVAQWFCQPPDCPLLLY